MNPLPRFLGTALFVVLAILSALVAASLWPHPAGALAAGGATVTFGHGPLDPQRSARLALFSQHAILVLSLLGTALSVALLFSLSLRPGRSDTRPPIRAARQELSTLTQLAQSTAAQGAELSREREVRRRAEEDARLKQQLLADSVDEKIRLGRDLHDGIIQSLYAVGLTIETARPLVRTDPPQAERRLEEVRATLNGAIRDVRAYITGLAPDNLRRASFSRGVNTLFEQLRAGRAAQFEINVDDGAAALLTVDQNIEALQIAREAISNALRHGEASRITLRMHRSDDEVCLLVQDNGRGFDPGRSADNGRGLANMRARAERVGATLRLSSQPAQGTRVIVNFPVPPSP